jgi:hypothetical protein
MVGARGIVLLVVAILASAGVSRANANQILDLAAQSDVVMLGEATAMSSNELNAVRFELRVDLALKGDLPAGSSVSATLSGMNQGSISDGRIRIPQPLPEMYGLWFLKRTAAGAYLSIPRQSWTYHFEDAVVRLPRSWKPPRNSQLDRTLLAAALAAYRHAGSNSDWIRRGEPQFADIFLKNSLEHAGRFGGREAALGILDVLLASGGAAERHIGIATGLAVSYDAAIAKLTSDLAANRLDREALQRILPELWKYDASSDLGASRIESLMRWNQSARVPELDSALVGSLGHVSGPSRLPLIAVFLDSPERGAVQLAVRLFYLYSVLAREDGTVATDGRGGAHPFYNETTKSHAGNDPSMLEADAEFWRSWWTKTRPDIEARLAARPLGARSH